MILKGNSRIHIIGGGPAGSFFAIHLLNEAKKADRNLGVTIIDKRIVNESDSLLWKLKGCNYCAGVISPQLYKALMDYQIQLPEEIICEAFTHIWIHGHWKNFPLKVPSDQTLCSVFRGSLPPDRRPVVQGLDAFLLKQAVDAGASLMPGTVETIQYTDSRRPRLSVKASSGKAVTVDSDFVCMSTGVNFFKGKIFDKNRFLDSYMKINPSFKPPRTRPTLVVELKPGKTYLKKYMDKELYLIVSGSKDLHLEHVALVPKGDYLTIALVGKSIDTASFPEDASRIINAFLSLFHVQTILPHINLDNTPISCMCNPFMAVGFSNSPVEDRIAVIGDALGARLYRDGLYSAFISAKTVAKAVIYTGVDKVSLTRTNHGMMTWLKTDNQYCRIVFGLIQTILKSGLLSRIFYQTFASEMKFRKKETWPLGQILWKIGSGSAGYVDVFKSLFSFPVFRSFMIGGFKTFRNILTELFFGLAWGPYGRYPTVILKDKRAVIKQSIQASLGITLDDAPQMERMYAIKIRASSKAIFEELGKFGEKNAQFLRLRFVDVKRTQGTCNQVGSIVRYAPKIQPISMDIRLIRCIPNQTLLYEPEELFAKNGILLFDISPTKDGNNRLVIYTAFDYKKGNTIFEKFMFKLLRKLFPDYAHDVVWNHAVCSIKAQAEHTAGLINQKKRLIG